MKAPLRERILGYLRTNRQARVHDLVRALSPVSRVAIHRWMRILLVEGLVKKIGKPPIVFYVLERAPAKTRTITISPDTKQILDAHYLYINPKGELLFGVEGFKTWVVQTKQQSQMTALAARYHQTLVQYEHYRRPKGWIDATTKLTETFNETFMDKLLYANFYSFPQFGKTKLGSMVLYAKQSQNRELTQLICREIKPLIEQIIIQFQIDAIGFIPPSIPRQIQFLHELKTCLNLPYPHIPLVKIRTGSVIVAQKTLEKLEERVENARSSIFTKERTLPYRRVLLVDDAVGSGASMNETARKIRSLFPETKNKNSKTVIGFAIVGSIKGFEVIREV